MKTKKFANKKIIIRSLSTKDLRQVKKFQIFINSLIKEDVQIKINKKKSLKEELDWLKEHLVKIKKKKAVFLVAEYNNEIVGSTGIDLNRGKKEHVGEFGITIRKDYRGVGLGKYLMGEVIKLARTKLKPKTWIIRLSVFATNKPAIRLYERCGFKIVAKIPKQVKHKGKLIDEIIMLLNIKYKKLF